MGPRLFLWVLTFRLYSSGGRFNALAGSPNLPFLPIVPNLLSMTTSALLRSSCWATARNNQVVLGDLTMNLHRWGRGLRRSFPCHLPLSIYMLLTPYGLVHDDLSYAEVQLRCTCRAKLCKCSIADVVYKTVEQLQSPLSQAEEGEERQGVTDYIIL